MTWVHSTNKLCLSRETPMKFVLFRHAQKGITPFEDPELSLKGYEQSGLLVDLIKNKSLPTPTTLFVSPKRRTSQTFYPISKHHNLTPQVSDLLDQRRSDENSLQFRQRVQNFLNTLETRTSNEVVYACTHYDWLEEAMTLIHCDRDLNTFEFAHWAPTQHVVFEVENNVWKFIAKGNSK
jgi:broad specificity phosphatase PhoE